MGAALTHVIPDDPWHVPSPSQLDAASALVKAHLHADSDAKVHGDLPQTLIGPETRFAATCPACGAVLDIDAFIGALGDAYDAANAADHSLPLTTPCCNAVQQIADFNFPIPWASERPDEPEWRDYQVAAFARASVTLWDFPRLITAAERAQLSAAMGCPVKLVWYGI